MWVKTTTCLGLEGGGVTPLWGYKPRAIKGFFQGREGLWSNVHFMRHSIYLMDIIGIYFIIVPLYLFHILHFLTWILFHPIFFCLGFACGSYYHTNIELPGFCLSRWVWSNEPLLKLTSTLIAVELSIIKFP